MTCKQCGTDEDRINGFCSIECRDNFDYEEEIRELRAENEALKNLAINFIQHSVEIRSIQMKCFAGEYKDVKDVGINMPSYQTTALHRKLKAISKMDYDNAKCGDAITIILGETQ